MTKLTSWKLRSTSFLHAPNFKPISWNIVTSGAITSLSLPLANTQENHYPRGIFLQEAAIWKMIRTYRCGRSVSPLACSCSIISLTKFSLVSRVISCCRLASMRASGGSCRFWARSCCCRLFSSFRLWISPRSDSSSFSWLFFCDWSWDSSSLRRLSNSLCEHTWKVTSPILRGSVKL